MSTQPREFTDPAALSACIRHVRPKVDAPENYALRVQEGVVSIDYWFSAETEPTQEELAAAWFAVRQRQRMQEMAEISLSKIRSLFRTKYPDYEVLGIHNARLLSTAPEDYPPRYTAAMELIRDTNLVLEQKLYELASAATIDELEAVSWS